ncbi:hypothetical protein JW964_02335, partial [candidate division KSB1 bacterium]|nr:hypothetical protein [candidate division KSB1 bacterium]
MKSHRMYALLAIAFTVSFIFSGCGKDTIQYEPETFTKDWLIVGPFPNCEDCSTTDYHHDERCQGFYTDYLESIGGEKNAIPTEGMQVEYAEKNIVRTWFKHHSAENEIHLAKFLKPKDMVVAYAFCQIASPKAQKSILSIGSNDGIRVFLNGEEIHESHDFNGRWLQIDNDY